MTGFRFSHRMRSAIVALFSAALVHTPAAAQADPLAPTGEWSANQAGHAPLPPMGWNSWNAFFYDIDEEKVLASAQIMIDSGLAEAGYRYVNLDDGWWLQRRQPDGRMVIHTERFPSAATGEPGMTSFRPFTDRIHAMGLKAGIYSDIGRNTCGQAYGGEGSNQPQGSILEREVGLYGYIDQDIELYFREWGFDYIKVDGCGIRTFGEDFPRVAAGTYRALPPLIDMTSTARTDIAAVQQLFNDVADALVRHNPDNDFVFSICLWGSSNVRAWAKTIGNLSRTSDDITPSWSRLLTNFDTTVTRALYAQPGSWNDPDMLFIGQGEFDADHMKEARSHFALWAITNAPLLIGYDLRAATPEQLALLGHREIIALNQDRAGHQAVPVYHSGDIQILVKTLENGDKGVAVFNRGLAPLEAVLNADHLKMRPDAPVSMVDLWTGEAASFAGETVLQVAPRETLVFRASGERALPEGVFVSELPGSVNVAEDGVIHPAHDPTIHRNILPWTGTRGAGEMPSYAGWGGAQADRSPFNEPLRLDGQIYTSGIGILANSRLEVRNAGFTAFRAEVGIDDTAALQDQEVSFAVFGDGRLLAETAMLTAASGAVDIAADIDGIEILELVVRTDGQPGFGLPVVWGNARMLR